MANLLARRKAPTPAAGVRGLSWMDLQAAVSYAANGTQYTITGSDMLPAADFVSMVHSVNEATNVVSAAVFARALLLKQTRFVWRNIRRADPNYRQLFGTRDLAMLERPDPGVMTRPQMLATMETHISYGGNAYCVDRGDRLELLRPDRVEVVLQGVDDVDSVMGGMGRKAGYLHFPSGFENPDDSEAFLLHEVAHWTPEPHPLQWWIGSSWVRSVLNEVATDKAATRFGQDFFKQGATPNLIIKPHEMLSPDQIDEYREKFTSKHEGVGNAYRTMWLGGGSDAQVVGSNLAEVDMSALQGGGESRVAMRSRVPSVILGTREGSSGSGLQTGFYASARRMLADGWYTPTVQDLCASFETLTPPPAGAELAHDPADVLFLQEDALEQAEQISKQATALQALDSAGFEADAAVKAVRDNNLSALLGSHDGLQSVQRNPNIEDDGGQGDDDV